jgi:succinyl-CoA synthetase beta subunit
MRLAEFDGKALLRRHGLAVPRGVLIGAGEDAPAEARKWPGHVLKAQVLEGGRGRRGLVQRLADLGELAPERARIAAALDDPEAPLLLEEAVPIAREIYLAVRIDGTRQGLELLVATEGGEDVETTQALARIPLGPAGDTTADALYPDLAGLFPRDVASRLARYAARLPEIARREDLELLEINPLALTADGRLVACDAKIVRDDSAAFRHDPDEFPLSRALAERALTELERSARDLGFHLVEIDGDVALVTAGAGLGMMMMDLLADHGLTAACFMDNLRGAPDETMAERLRIARALAQRPRVKAIVFQTVLASRSLADRIEALLAFLAAEPLPKPLFVGIAAGHAAARKMSAEAAVEKLAAAGIPAFTDPIALVRAVAVAMGGAPHGQQTRSAPSPVGRGVG